MSSFSGPASIKFYETCSKIGARARTRGEFGPDGHPVWSCDEWQSFCRAYDACQAWLPDMLWTPAKNTVDEVRAMLDDGFDAVSIHNVLAGTAAERDRFWRAKEQIMYRPEQTYLVDDDQR